MSDTKASPVATVVDRYVALRGEFEAQARLYGIAVREIGACTLGDTQRAVDTMDELARGLARLGEMAMATVPDEIDLRLYFQDAVP